MADRSTRCIACCSWLRVAACVPKRKSSRPVPSSRLCARQRLHAGGSELARRCCHPRAQTRLRDDRCPTARSRHRWSACTSGRASERSLLALRPLAPVRHSRQLKRSSSARASSWHRCSCRSAGCATCPLTTRQRCIARAQLTRAPRRIIVTNAARRSSATEESRKAANARRSAWMAAVALMARAVRASCVWTRAWALQPRSSRPRAPSDQWRWAHRVSTCSTRRSCQMRIARSSAAPPAMSTLGAPTPLPRRPCRLPRSRCRRRHCSCSTCCCSCCCCGAISLAPRPPACTCAPRRRRRLPGQ